MVIGRRFINIDNLSINLIDTINPFQRGYEILSKSVTAPVLKVVQNVIEESKIDMPIEEAIILFKKYLPQFKEEHNGALPELTDPNCITAAWHRLLSSFGMRNRNLWIKIGENFYKRK